MGRFRQMLIAALSTAGGTAFTEGRPGHESSVTYEAFYQAFLRAERFWKKNGLPEKTIGIFGANSFGWVLAALTSMSCGSTTALLDPNLREKALQDKITGEKIDTIFCPEEYKEILSGIEISEVITFSQLLSETAKQPCPGGSQIAQPPQTGEADFDRARPVLLFFSSGTTGSAKTVALTDEALAGRCGMLRNVKYPSGRFLHVLPFYHAFGFELLCSCLLQQHEVVIASSPKYLWKYISMYRPSHLSMVPLQAETILSHFEKKEDCFVRTLELSSAPVGEKLLETMKRFGITYMGRLGSSETGIITSGFTEIPAVGYVGRPFGGAEVRLLQREEDGRGELAVKSPGLFSGYLEMGRLNRECLKDGFFHTGDIGRMDAHEQIFLTGRAQNRLILPSGEKVNAEELESVLGRMHGILECRVSAPEGVLTAEIYAPEKEEAQVEAMVLETNKTLVPYKRITRVILRKIPLEKTSSGKIKRFDEVKSG